MSHKRVYPEEFRREALELAEKIGIIAASKDLGINPANIRRWRLGLKKTNSSGRGVKSLEDLETELRRLKKENLHLRNVGDILKKSLGIISKDQI